MRCRKVKGGTRTFEVQGMGKRNFGDMFRETGLEEGQRGGRGVVS